MFKLDLSSTYKWPVKFNTVDANGLELKHEITLEFKRFSREELIELDKEKTDIPKTAGEVLLNDMTYLRKFVINWEGVEINGETDFSATKLQLLLSAIPAMNRLITQAFFESSQGGFARKN